MRGQGWRYESGRHSLAARGMKSATKRIPRVKYPKTHIEEIMEDMYFVRNDYWICQLDNGRDIHLGLVFQILDEREFNDEMGEDEEYPYAVEAQIMVVPEEFSKKYREEVASGSGVGPEDITIYDAVSYGGGIPVTRELEGISSSRKSSVDSKTATRKDGRAFWRYFKTADDAEKYIKEIYTDHADALFGLIGFTLDHPVNLIGTTGWDLISNQKKGTDWLKR